MSCGCIRKVCQALYPINTLGSCSSKPQSTQAVGPDLVRTANRPPSHPQIGILLGGKPQAMDVLPPIPHVLWVHKQGLTIMGHNQYTGILIIQASEHPSSGAKFGGNCKNTKPSSGWCILLGE